MNERIKELAFQASENYDYHPEFAEKFAELLVRECVDMFPDDLNSMSDYTGKACRYMIKEHFWLTKTVVGSTL